MVGRALRLGGVAVGATVAMTGESWGGDAIERRLFRLPYLSRRPYESSIDRLGSDCVWSGSVAGEGVPAKMAFRMRVEARLRTRGAAGRSAERVIVGMSGDKRGWGGCEEGVWDAWRRGAPSEVDGRDGVRTRRADSLSSDARSTAKLALGGAVSILEVVDLRRMWFVGRTGGSGGGTGCALSDARRGKTPRCSSNESG